MAVPPENNVALMREVDDEVRREQLIGFWQRWGRLVIAAVVVALAAFAGFLFWQHYRDQVEGEQGEQLSTAYDAIGAKDVAKATPVLANLSTSSSDGYRAMAIFAQGDLLLQKNDLKGAAAKFASVADDTGMAQPFRNLALIRQTSAEFDTLKPGVVVERLRPLATKDGAWLGSAGELVAAAYLAEGRRDLAGRMFAQIAAGKDVPASLRQRAVQMAGVLGVDAVAANEEVQGK